MQIDAWQTHHHCRRTSECEGLYAIATDYECGRIAKFGYCDGLVNHLHVFDSHCDLWTRSQVARRRAFNPLIESSILFVSVGKV